MIKKCALVKSSEGAGSEFFIIEGIASTFDRDSYDEVINQFGIDLSLVKEDAVHLNIEHGDGFPLYELSVVGIISDAKITKDGLWIKAKVFWDHPHAERLYAEIKKSPESVQLSVELGDCIYGDEKFADIILTGTLVGVALTKNPANDATYTELAKSLRSPELVEVAQELRDLNRAIRKISRKFLKRKITVITGIR